MNYIQHFCKNPKCNAGWLDEDLKKSQRPVTWKYCYLCVSQGKKNPDKPPVNENLGKNARDKKLLNKA